MRIYEPRRVILGGKEVALTLLESVLCGIVQGLTEFLPVSSSGHLALMHAVFGMETAESNLTFDILLHLGTLIVVFVFYFREIFSLIPAFFTMLGKVFRGKFAMKEYTANERFVVLLILATLPLAAALFIDDAVSALAAYTKVIGAILIFNGAVLLFSDHIAKKTSTREELTPLGAFGVGCFQLIAVFPGLSRSGSTISGGLLFGLSREDAVKFSFILSVPAILGANIMNVPEVLTTSIPKAELSYYLIGMACAMISGFLAMKLLIYISKKSRFGFFAYYCFAVGALAVIFG